MKAFKKFLICLLVGIATMSVQAPQSYAVVSYQALPPQQTPLILKTFYTEVETFKKESKSGDLKNFWFHFEENADEAFNEILKSLNSLNPNGDTSLLVLQEFDRLKKNMTERGFEPSQNLYWAPPKDFVISYDKESVGPKAYPGFADEPVEGYTHSFEFEYRLNYQPKGKVLKGHQRYPRLVLKGALSVECKAPFAGCQVYMTTVDEAGIRWEQVPGFKGGNSSSGK